MKKMVKVIAISTIAISMLVIPELSFAKPAYQNQEMLQLNSSYENGDAKKASAKTRNRRRKRREEKRKDGYG